MTSQLHGTHVVYFEKFRCSRISSSQMSIYFRSSRCSRNSVDILHIHSYEIYFNVIFSSTSLFHGGLFHSDSSTKIPLSIAYLSHRYDMLHAYQPLKHSFIIQAVSNCLHAFTLVFFCDTLVDLLRVFTLTRHCYRVTVHSFSFRMLLGSFKMFLSSLQK